MSQIDIGPFSKAAVLAALYNATAPLKVLPDSEYRHMTEDEAERHIEAQKQGLYFQPTTHDASGREVVNLHCDRVFRFAFVNRRVLNLKWKAEDTLIDVTDYDLVNGDIAHVVWEMLRESNDPCCPDILNLGRMAFYKRIPRD